jgi:hypothetical protein
MRAWLLAGVLSLVACAGEGAGGVAPVAPAAGGGDLAASLGVWEASWLEELGATDPRLAQRLKVKPTSGAVERAAATAVVRGEGNVGVVDGAIDLFSFDERARRLGVLRLELSRMPDDGSPRARQEKLLLTRLLDAEDLRVKLERDGPDSASERVRAMVAVWGRPSSPREVAARESMVERGLVDVVPAVQQGELRRARALELEDALDPLERLAVPEGYPRATQAITLLRVELGRQHPAPAPSTTTTPALVTLLEAYVGLLGPLDLLAAHLDDEEATLRLEAKDKLKQMPDHTAAETLAQAAGRIEGPFPCADSERTSLALALAPPPERAGVCNVLDLADKSEQSLATGALAAIVLHDEVAIALWAFALAQGATDLDATRTAHPLLASVPPDRQDRLVRGALVTPARACAAGAAALLLDADGPSERRGRAVRWAAFGDAPLDIVAHELGAKR